MRKRKIVIAFSILLLICLAVIYCCNKLVANAAAGKLYSDVNLIPYNKTGLLLGTSKYDDNGRLNPFFTYRINAAIELFKAGKIKYIIVSGDNGSTDYNEPDQMRADLIAAGIDSSLIFEDFAGFRTFDSIVRAKAIFGQDSITIISQPFHNERALYLAAHEGMYAVACNAKDVGNRIGFKVQVREKLARVKLFLDLLFHKAPKFLGEKIIIP